MNIIIYCSDYTIIQHKIRDETHCFGTLRQVVLMVTLMLQRSGIQLKRCKMRVKYTAQFTTHSKNSQNKH